MNTLIQAVVLLCGCSLAAAAQSPAPSPARLHQVNAPAFDGRKTELEMTEMGISTKTGDVGAVKMAGHANYDAATNSYTVSGGGENMWAATDAFHFLTKQGVDTGFQFERNSYGPFATEVKEAINVLPVRV